MSEGEWTQRELCPDGSCVGVIGDDGTCKVCGRAAPNWGDERTRGLKVQAEADEDPADDDEDEDDDEEYEDDDEDGEDEDDEEADEGDDDGTISAKAEEEPKPAPKAKLKPSAKGSGEWAERALCENGACIGVIGDDGKCKVCGKAP